MGHERGVESCRCVVCVCSVCWGVRVRNGEPMTTEFAPDVEQVGSLSYADRAALAHMVAALAPTPAPESLPLLSPEEYELLLGHLRLFADEHREAAGTRGIEIFKAVQ